MQKNAVRRSRVSARRNHSTSAIDKLLQNCLVKLQQLRKCRQEFSRLHPYFNVGNVLRYKIVSQSTNRKNRRRRLQKLNHLSFLFKFKLIIALSSSTVKNKLHYCTYFVFSLVRDFCSKYTSFSHWCAVSMTVAPRVLVLFSGMDKCPIPLAVIGRMM